MKSTTTRKKIIILPAIRCLPGIAALVLGAATSADARVNLVRDGRAMAAVVRSAEPDSLEARAATELVTHLRLMTGVELSEVTPETIPAGMLPVFLGSAADPALDPLSRAARVNRSSFTIRVAPERIDIRGLSDEGTLFGVYELLEQIGFRWYTIGDVGRIVPEGDTVRVAIQESSQGPSFVYRNLQHVPIRWPWSLRARLGGDERSTGRHGIPGLGRGLFEEHPELFSFHHSHGARRRSQHCLSNPETLRRATEAVREEAIGQGGEVQYVGAASFDGGGYCECDGCRAMDGGVYDPFGDRESMTDRYILFFNNILEQLEKDLPNLHIVHYTYAAHMMPPAVDMNPRIVPVFAPITMERVRSMDNPMGVDRYPLRWLIDEYAARGVREMYYRGYFGNLACVNLPWSQLDRMRNDIPALAEKGVTVMRVETIWPTWSSNFLNWYVASRLMWDVTTDVDALLDEFYRLYYGPAEAPMRAYHEGLEAAFRDTPYKTGSTYLYFPIFKNHPRRAELRGHLDAAAGMADGRYAERISNVRFNWDRLDLFMDMMQARNRHDFAAAHALMTDYNEKTAWGASTPFSYADEDYTYSRDGRFLVWREHPDQGGSYFNRFFRRPVVSGYERTEEIGEQIAPLADEWQFLLDPADIGEIGGWHRPGELGGNWQPMKTSSRSWSDQGLHYYKGVAWYRQQVEIPEGFEDRPVYLWFGGVDRLASVWINGHFMGTSREPREGVPGVPGSFRPFDMPTVREDGSSALNAGGDNWVVVRIENHTLAELGTGGILAPVMFWAPRDPAWNPRD